METIAIYWEEKVKIYGITIKKDLSLLSFHPNETGNQQLSGFCSAIGANMQTFAMTAYQCSPTPRLDLIIPTETLDSVAALLAPEQDSTHDHFTIIRDVNMISLHGPHFQDRFGIAAVAFNALEKHKLEVLLNCCTGTSLQLIFHESDCQDAYNVLQKTFMIPTST